MSLDAFTPEHFGSVDGCNAKTDVADILMCGKISYKLALRA
jgi:hypothetical protein